MTCVDTSEVLFELFSMMTWVVANISVVCDDIAPDVVSMVVEGGFVGLTSSHVTLTSPVLPAGKTRYIYKYICTTTMISIIILAVLLYLLKDRTISSMSAGDRVRTPIIDNLVIEMSKRREAYALLYERFGFLTDTSL
jgi:hypothetical protein